MANKKIQLEFFSSTLSEDESKKAEFTGMLILASDYIKTGKVAKAEDLIRISKALLPIYLSRTKTGKYLALNPSGSNILQVPIMQLPSLEDITTFVSEPNNLDLEKLYKELMKFKMEEANLRGGYNAKHIRAIEEILRAPREDRNDFKLLPMVGDTDLLKKQLKIINNLVYDENSLDKAIVERIKIIENALIEESKEYKLKYDERANFWKAEIDNASTNLKKKLKERDKQLEVDLKKLDKDTQKKIKDAIKLFFQGVAKNIRKDEVPIEKLIVDLETVSSKEPKVDNIGQITTILEKLRDHTNTFHADIDFQMRKVRTVGAKEQDLLEIQQLDIKGLENRAERDKNELIEESKNLEKTRDEEMQFLKTDREAAKLRVSQFKDRKGNWINDIKEAIGGKGTAMISAESLKIESPSPIVELLVPVYIFQYRKNENIYTVCIPPVKLPNSMKKTEKGSISGDHKTVYFIPTVPELNNILVSWLEKSAEDLDISSNIQLLSNILDNPTNIRNQFFESQSLFTDKLKVNKGKLSSSNKRLTSAFSTN